MGIPGPRDLRLVAQWLEETFPLTDMPALVNRQHYTLAHELTGAHDAISELRTLADNLDEANRLTEPE